jgi:hypothetical protein
LTIPRRFLWENSCLDSRGRFSPSVMSCLTCGVYDLAVSSCRRRHGAEPSGRRRHSVAATQEVG